MRKTNDYFCYFYIWKSETDKSDMLCKYIKSEKPIFLEFL